MSALPADAELLFLKSQQINTETLPFVRIH
jgi:hypothetical protein